MVVNYFNVKRRTISPNKANTKLIVYSNTMLPRSVTAQCLQPIARWHTQIIKNGCSLQLS